MLRPGLADEVAPFPRVVAGVPDLGVGERHGVVSPAGEGRQRAVYHQKNTTRYQQAVHGTRRPTAERKNPRSLVLSRVSVLLWNVPEYSLVPRAGIELPYVAGGSVPGVQIVDELKGKCLGLRSGL